MEKVKSDAVMTDLNDVKLRETNDHSKFYIWNLNKSKIKVTFPVFFLWPPMKVQGEFDIK